MAFDAGFLSCVAAEQRETALGARIEKVYQPEKDAIVLLMRTFAGGRRLLINAGSANPRIGFTAVSFENPQTPPQFCLLLRKHLSSAKLVDIRQEGFERVLRLEWETRNEMGDLCRRVLIAEIMGKYSNLIFTDGDGKILAALRPVDFTTSTKRQVLPGMRYELPPPQSKENPLTCDYAGFAALYARGGDMPVDKFITASFLGVSASVAREIAYRACGRLGASLCEVAPDALYAVFSGIFADIKAERYAPCIVTDENQRPVEYAFLPLTHYGAYQSVASPSALLDEWFGTRDKEARVRQRAADLLRLLYNAKTRILHKLELQRTELAQCELGEEYRRQADLIVANCYRLSKGMTRVLLTDYADCREDGSFGEVEVELDARLTPTDNAQRLYKKYNKSKTARVELGKQIAIGEQELQYLK
ncbi:MAG: NFACT family protein, partial [Clostridia bacterium]|nr:NFACT family protein [Clostridia bacterium]